MSSMAIELEGVCKAYRFFHLQNISLQMQPGTIMGLIGPNGAGKSTTIRILMGLVRQDLGEVRVLGNRMPDVQVAAKWDIGFASEDMRLYGSMTLGWHMNFVQSIYPSWDAAYSWMMRMAAERSQTAPREKAPPDRIGSYWFAAYERADVLAGEYAERYRSCYVLIIALTALTVIFAAMAGATIGIERTPAHPGPPEWLAIVIAVLELGTLLSILALVMASLRYRWHEKSVDDRLLAELFRKQQMLASLGWSLPFNNVRVFADSDRMAWISWLFAATVRQGPLAQEFPLAYADRVERVETLLRAQIDYRRKREHTSERALRRIDTVGAAAYFGVALRSYSELQLLTDQSEHMIHLLQQALARVQRLDSHRILVDQDLGSEASTVAQSMLQDLEGWERLFRGKPTVT